MGSAALRPDVYRAQSAMMNARRSPLAKSVLLTPRILLLGSDFLRDGLERDNFPRA